MDYSAAAFGVSVLGIVIILADRLFRGGSHQAQTDTRLEKLEARFAEHAEILRGFKESEAEFRTIQAQVRDICDTSKELRTRTHGLRNDLNIRLGHIDGHIEELMRRSQEKGEEIKMIRANLHGTKDVLSGLIMKVELDLRDHIAECRGRKGRRE